MKQIASINRNKQKKQIMKQTIQLVAINMKQTDSINRNKHETDRFN